MSNKNIDRVFLSYAQEDIKIVEEIYKGLKKRKVNVWFDKIDIHPGKWLPQIMKIMPRSKYFIICLSNAALHKTGDEKPGFIDYELNTAYRIALEQPESNFTIIPVKLEDCGRGDIRTSTFQQYDLFKDFESGLDRLAIVTGGISLIDQISVDDRTEDEKLAEKVFGKALTYYYAEDFKQSLELMNTVLILQPNKADFWLNKAVILAHLDQEELAIEHLKRAIELNPRFDLAWHSLGIAMSNIDRHTDGVTYYKKAIEINPDEAEYWFHLARSLGHLSLHDEEVAAYRTALKLKPNSCEIWDTFGYALKDLERYEEALVAFHKAVELKPDLGWSWHSIREILEKLDRQDEARTLSAEAEELNGGPVFVTYPLPDDYYEQGATK